MGLIMSNFNLSLVVLSWEQNRQWQPLWQTAHKLQIYDSVSPSIYLMDQSIPEQPRFLINGKKFGMLSQEIIAFSWFSWLKQNNSDLSQS